MLSLPEQLSAARKWQFESQFNLFQTLASQVLARTEQVIALNLDTSRAAVERSSNAVRQLFAINDPRDLVTLGSQGQAQFEQMLAYSRELFSIASGAQPARWPRPAASSPPPANWLPPAQPAPAPASDDAAPAGFRAAAQGARPGREPVVAIVPDAAPAPVAQENPIARAASALVSAPAEPQHPLASPVAAADTEVGIPPIAPVEAAPPPAPVSGTPEIEAKNGQRAKSRNNRKK